MKSKTLNIFNIADLHFSAINLDEIKLYNELKEIFFKELRKRKPDVISIVGDLFDKKVSLNSSAVSYCNKFIYELITEFPETYILLIHGTLSHDYMQLDSFNQYISEYFRIYKTTAIDYICGMKLLIIPEEYHEDKSFYDQYLKTEDKYDFVYIHGLFQHIGAYATFEGMRKNKICFNYKDFEKNVYGRVNCGHIHDHSEYKNIDYNGSFSRWKHGEEKDKGFIYYEYDVNKHKVITKEFIVNTLAPKWITIPYEDLEKNVKELYKQLIKYSKDNKCTRIFISPTSDIDKDFYNSLIQMIKEFNNIVLEKAKTKLIVNDKQTEEENNKVKERIERYQNKTFEEITIEFAKDEFNASVTKDDIIEVLNNK